MWPLLIWSFSRGCDMRAVAPSMSWWAVVRRVLGWSLSELGELGDVVGEDSVSAPDPSAGVTAQAGAAPAEITFEVRDAAFASGAPLHCGDEHVFAFDALACL